MASMDRFRSLLASVLMYLLAKVGIPIAVTIKGQKHRALLLADRRLVLPAIAGGSPEADDDDDQDTDDDDSGDGSDDADDDDGADSGDDDDDADDDGADGDPDDAADRGRKGSGRDRQPPKADAPASEWRAYARHLEGRRRNRGATRKLQKELAKANDQLEKLKNDKKDERQKAIDAAREEGKKEALTEAQKERRSDRLEVAVTRLSAKGIKDGEGDDAKTLKFADSEDVLLYIQKAIDSGDIDADDIFDDKGKVDADVLTEELLDLAARKPHWLAGSSNDADADAGRSGKRKVKGGADAGKGKGGKDGEPSVADIAKSMAEN